jgi:hypothetical protein
MLIELPISFNLGNGEKDKNDSLNKSAANGDDEEKEGFFKRVSSKSFEHPLARLSIN